MYDMYKLSDNGIYELAYKDENIMDKQKMLFERFEESIDELEKKGFLTGYIPPEIQENIKISNIKIECWYNYRKENVFFLFFL